MREHVAECLKGRSALVALSGGVDSVVLLHLLLSLGARVVAAHVEHGIRGENSRRDCAFVQEMCRARGVMLTLTHLDVPAEARRRGTGLEETAREMRYAFLRRERERLRLDVIVTAHHMDDQAETVLLHLLRGASARGLGGMREEQDGLLRPLLPFSRAQILRYAQENALPFVEDETNADTAFSRNYIRCEVMPRLRRLNPRAGEALCRLAELSRAQSDYIAREAERALRENLVGEALQDAAFSLHEGLRGEVLRRYLITVGLREPELSDVRRLEALHALPAGKRASFASMLLERDARGVRPVRAAADFAPVPLHLGENETPLGRLTLRLAPVPEELDLGKDAQALDAEALRVGLTLRARRPGDRMRLLGGGSKLVSDLLSQAKVPRALREASPVVECGGEIVWLPGVRAGAAYSITNKSAQALILQYSKPKE